MNGVKEKVTEELKANQEIVNIKKRLEKTKGLAKKQAKLVQAGSGYGTFATKNKKNWPSGICESVRNIKEVETFL